MLLHKNTIIALMVLGSFVALGWVATGETRGIHKNLQVLPQDITAQKLDSIMNAYNVALGVNCRFCHVAMKNMPDSLDYAADTEPMKEEARKMMRMNIYINKTYFYFNKEERPEYLTTVHCNTCHRGEAFPEQ